MPLSVSLAPLDNISSFFHEKMFDDVCHKEVSLKKNMQITKNLIVIHVYLSYLLNLTSRKKRKIENYFTHPTELVLWATIPQS